MGTFTVWAIGFVVAVGMYYAYLMMRNPFSGLHNKDVYTTFAIIFACGWPIVIPCMLLHCAIMWKFFGWKMPGSSLTKDEYMRWVSDEYRRFWPEDVAEQRAREEAHRREVAQYYREQEEREEARAAEEREYYFREETRREETDDDDGYEWTRSVPRKRGSYSYLQSPQTTPTRKRYLYQK